LIGPLAPSAEALPEFELFTKTEFGAFSHDLAFASEKVYIIRERGSSNGRTETPVGRLRRNE
jgi:hypothetical protein